MLFVASAFNQPASGRALRTEHLERVTHTFMNKLRKAYEADCMAASAACPPETPVAQMLRSNALVGGGLIKVQGASRLVLALKADEYVAPPLLAVRAAGSTVLARAAACGMQQAQTHPCPQTDQFAGAS